MTTVVNLHHDSHDVYIGRGSIYGNPFHIGKDGNRKQVIDKYRVYFYNRLAHDTEFKQNVMSLKDKVLGCFCKPEACHGDVIAAYLNDEDLF